MQGERGLLVMLVDDGHGLAGRLASSIREMGHQVEATESAVALRLARAIFPDVVVVEFGWNTACDIQGKRTKNPLELKISILFISWQN
ncbi:MAG: hypothetical protein K8U57_18235 [Planctomycetes bacterium]|nr:hypothetical protein [Planctomycetota bacterium]